MWDDCSTIRVCRKNLKKIVVICFIIVAKNALVNISVTSTGRNPGETGAMGGRVAWVFNSCCTKAFNLSIYFIIFTSCYFRGKGGGAPFISYTCPNGFIKFKIIISRINQLGSIPRVRQVGCLLYQRAPSVANGDLMTLICTGNSRPTPFGIFTQYPVVTDCPVTSHRTEAYHLIIYLISPVQCYFRGKGGDHSFPTPIPTVYQIPNNNK